MKAAFLCIIADVALVFANPAETIEWERTIAEAVELSRTGQYMQSEQAYRKALAFTRGFEKGDARRAHTLNGLCAISYELGRSEEAETHCNNALREVPQPSSVESRYANLDSLHLLAALHMQAGRLADAERNLVRIEAGLVSLDPLQAPYSKIVGTLHYDRGFIDLLLGRLDKAEASFKKAVEAFGRENPDHVLVLACTLSHLSSLNIPRKRFAEAEAYAKEAIERIASRYGPEHPGIARDLNNLGVIYLLTGRASEAEEPLRHAIALIQAAYGPDDESLGSLQVTYSRVLKQLGRKAEAKAMQKKADLIAARHQESHGVRPGKAFVVDVQALTNAKR